MFIDERSCLGTAPHRGAMCRSRVTAGHGAPTERVWFRCYIYKHCTPTECLHRASASVLAKNVETKPFQL
jgi:hypothetical protein